jgi:D-serine dehydratase
MISRRSGKGSTWEPALLDWTLKGLPPRAEGRRSDELRALNLRLLEGDLMMPVAILRESCLINNRRWMREFLALTGVRLCPHGKTTMSPELFRMQIEDGVWGMTAATAHHTRVYRHFGVQRVLLANQLIGKADIAYVLGEIAADPGFDFYCLVDSMAGVRLLEEAAATYGAERTLQVLLEVGARGGRTGVRSTADGIDVANAVASSPHLALRGVESFEGIFGTAAPGAEQVSRMLDETLELGNECLRRGLFAAEPVLLSAGGSAFFDLCAARLKASPLASRAEIILRPGCYLTQDHGMYESSFDRLRARMPKVAALGSGLQPALEVWTQIQSVPEDGRAIAAFGKRDASYDAELPRPLRWYRPSLHDQPVPVPPGCRVSKLFDQHASVDAPANFCAVGDYMGFGISHPCTTFDKWRILLIVDDEYRVTSAVTTYF